MANPVVVDNNYGSASCLVIRDVILFLPIQ